MMKKGFIIRLLESFLCAGSSALLISVGHSHPEFWFLSLFALVPFLWRVINTETAPRVVSRSGSESPPVAGRETRPFTVRSGLGSPVARCDLTENVLPWNTHTHEMNRQRVVGRVPNPPQADKKPDSGIATSFMNKKCRVIRAIRLQRIPLRTRPTSSVIPGMILATCYVLVAYPAELYTNPGAFLLKLFALNLIFSLYGIAVNRLKKHVGFNVIFIAVLWLPLEYALSHYAGLGNLFALSTGESSLLLGSLFGLLMISFIIVLINSLILIILRQVAQVVFSRGTLSIPDDKQAYPLFKEIILERRWYYFPDVRAPPLSGRTI